MSELTLAPEPLRMTDDPRGAAAPEEEPDADEPEEPASEREPERVAPAASEPVRFSLTTMLGIAMLVGAGSFAAGRSFAPAAPLPPIAESPPQQPQPPSGGLMGPSGPPGGPGMGGMGSEGLPPGHPPTGAGDPASMGMGMGPGAVGDVAPSALSWKAPARWQQVPNASTMRLATYRVPRAPGDTEDAELTIMQAGGSVEANAQRWIGQFGPEGAKTAKQSTRTVGTLAVAIVEVEGKFAGGMGREGREDERWAMLGAIIQTTGMPHFFKLTGPVKSVKSARAEFDALVASVSLKK
ncbi:MAG: hypothetical protein IPQ09_12065 [Myxococcales bacterium]|nr:hypothetical protein [Myxococcales bacterium]